MTLIAASLLGLLLFIWPLLGGTAPPELPALAAIAAAVLVLSATEVSARRLDSRRLALLAVIAATDAALRAVLVTGIAGFSPIFFLVLCAGFVFGPTYGFLCGSLSLLASALVTGGIGPWLPYEMFGLGWSGAIAGVAGHWRRGRAGAFDVGLLAAISIAVGFGYGALLDLWDWTLLPQVGDIGWTAGASPMTELAHFATFYLASSLVWDSFRAAGTAAMVILAGKPVLAAMARVRARFTYVVETDTP